MDPKERVFFKTGIFFVCRIFLKSVIDEIVSWSSNNKFQLRPKKCNELRMSFSRYPVNHELIETNGHSVDKMKVIKLLGIKVKGTTCSTSLALNGKSYPVPDSNFNFSYTNIYVQYSYV